jgi:MATE family multidrug resistance protein
MNIIAGWIGGFAVAAWAIVLNVAAIVFMVPLGLATGAAVRVSRAYGAREPAGVRRAGWVAFGVTVVFGVIATAIVWPLAGMIAPGYTANPATLSMAIPALAFSAIMYAPDALQVVAAQSLRARGDVWVPTGTHLTSYIALMMPLAWWLAIPLHFGIMGMVASIVISSFVSGGLLLARFVWLSRGPL